MRHPPALELPLLGACIAIIGVVDYFSGPDIGFSLFYLAPIVWSAWHSPRVVALGLAGVAAACWFTADAAWHGVTPVTLWNAFTRLGIYVGVAWLMSQVRADQRRLQDLNTKLRQLLEEEQLLARTDALTGLPNRRLFTDELRRAIARSRRTKNPMAIAYVDLDGFKRLNDRLGHSAGDAALRTVGQVVAANVRGNDVAARIGGDEFAVLLEECTVDTARSTAERLLEELREPLGRLPEAIGASIGVACFDVPPDAPQEALDHADAAMFCAKGRGSNSIYITHLARTASGAISRS